MALKEPEWWMRWAVAEVLVAEGFGAGASKQEMFETAGRVFLEKLGWGQAGSGRPHLSKHYRFDTAEQLYLTCWAHQEFQLHRHERHLRHERHTACQISRFLSSIACAPCAFAHRALSRCERFLKSMMTPVVQT